MCKIMLPRAKPYAAIRKHKDGSEILDAFFYSQVDCLTWILKQSTNDGCEWFVGEFNVPFTERNNEE